MEQQKEYHDPDYPTTSGHIKQEHETLSEAEKSQRICSIIRREFTQELEAREEAVMLIDRRLATSRRLLHRLRYTLVSEYYQEQKLLPTPAHIADEVASQTEPRAQSQVSNVLREGQRRLHPSVRKLLGKKTADLREILFTSRAPRSNARKDYCAMLQTRNYTIAADSTKSLRPSHMPPEPELEDKPRRMPRVLQPKSEKVLTIDEATRNQMKHRYRIIIGNTSKYAPSASRSDRSTHKWLLYVRGAGNGSGGAGEGADITTGGVVTGVTVRLHHSYAPHHTVHLTTPPFHVSRRGWGEFPAKLDIHFAMPERNRPATVEHTIKLDRNFTGLQTLGSETIVDVWLYSTPEMLLYEYKEPEETDWSNTQLTLVKSDDSTLTEAVIPKMEPADIENMEIDSLDNVEIPNVMTNENVNGQSDNWLDFFSNTTEVDVDEMFIKPVKKIEQKSDVENVIEANVIKKEYHSQIEVPNENEIENHVKDKCDIENDTRVNVDLSKVKTEVHDTHECVTNVRSHTKVIEDLPNELLTQPNSPKKRIMKYMDPTTGKIYYLEMDRNLDLSKVQEIVINSKGNIKTAKISPIKSNGLKNVRKTTKTGGVSLLKPEVKNSLKREETLKEIPVSQSIKKPLTVPVILKKGYTHIVNDHCYLECDYDIQKEDCRNETELQHKGDENTEEVDIKLENNLYDTLSLAIRRMYSVRVAVNYLLKNIPIISGEVRHPDFYHNFPFVVKNEGRYWKLDFAKRRNIEWSRAKIINKMLSEYFPNSNETIWRTKQILIYSRLHGFYPIRTETIRRQIQDQNNFYSWDDMDNTSTVQSSIKEIFKNPDDICSLSKFDIDSYHNNDRNKSDSIDLADSDEEIDVVECDTKDEEIKRRRRLPDSTSDLQVLPVLNEDDRLRFLFVERKCSEIGIELRNEDVGNGYSYSAVHAVLLSAMKSFAEELVRGSLADKLQTDRASLALPCVWIGSSSWRAPILLEHVLAATRQSRAAVLGATNLGTERRDHCYI